jgi:hypothetical protein
MNEVLTCLGLVFGWMILTRTDLIAGIRALWKVL